MNAASEDAVSPFLIPALLIFDSAADYCIGFLVLKKKS
jgi:hypothetical protein